MSGWLPFEQGNEGKSPPIEGDLVENADVFRRAPKHELLGAVAADRVRPMVEDLASIGHAARDISVLTGEAGLLVLDRFGRHHGLHGRLVRDLQQLGSSEANLINYADALGRGRSVIGVRTESLDDDLVAVFVRHRATDVVYFGATSARTLGSS
jgi:hypothetical protein